MPVIVLWRSYAPCMYPASARGCPASQGLRTFSDHACVQTNLTLFVQSMHSYQTQRGFVTAPALDVLSVSWGRQEGTMRIFQGQLRGCCKKREQQSGSENPRGWGSGGGLGKAPWGGEMEQGLEERQDFTWQKGTSEGQEQAWESVQASPSSSCLSLPKTLAQQQPILPRLTEASGSLSLSQLLGVLKFFLTIQSFICTTNT